METPATLSQLVVFRVQGSNYGLPVGCVAEVLRMVALTPLPEAASWMPGVLNLRGHVLPVVDLSARLGMPSIRPDLNTPIIVVAVDRGRFGVLVDVMVEVLPIPREAVETLTESGTTQGAICALARTGGQLIMVLDVHQLQAGIPTIA